MSDFLFTNNEKIYTVQSIKLLRDSPNQPASSLLRDFVWTLVGVFFMHVIVDTKHILLQLVSGQDFNVY